MINFTTLPLIKALNRHLDEIEQISAHHDDPLEPERHERLARSMLAHIKVLEALMSFNNTQINHDKRTEYLSYDDLPPPEPEDRDRIIAKIQLLYDRVNAAGEVSDISE